MPRGKLSSKRKPAVKRAGRRRTAARGSVRTGTSSTVHRRLVLYPNVKDASWLSTLGWYASIALKIIKLATGVTDDLKAASLTVGAGTVILLGPGDFAAHSPFAVPMEADNTPAYNALRTFQFERAALSTVDITIVPSADLGSRGGMYAACIFPVDGVDAMASDITATELLGRYAYDYDDIIKNPRARMAQVTKPLKLRLNVPPKPHSVRARWDAGVNNFINTYPSCALAVAFSDLAEKEATVSTNYAPNKSLFEIHMRGNLHLYDPAELKTRHEIANDGESNYTSTILTTDAGKSTVKWFDHRFEVEEDLDLRKIPFRVAKEMLVHYGRTDLLPALAAAQVDETSSFDMLT